MHSNEPFFLWYKIEAIFNKLIILQIEKQIKKITTYSTKKSLATFES